MLTMISIRLLYFHFVLTMLSASVILRAQEPYIKTLGIAEGVPSVTIYDLHVAKNGLLYLGTDKGLFSYDGIDFSKIEFVESLAVGVNGILEDENGTIWCKNFSSQIFLIAGNKLVLERHSAKYLNKSESNLADFFIYEGSIYLSTERKVVKINQNGEAKLLYQITSTEQLESITAIQFDTIGKILYISNTENIVALLPTGEFKMTPTIKGQTEILFFNNLPYSVFKGIRNEVVNHQNKLFKKPPIYLGSFIKLSEANDKLWLCTSQGVFRLDTQNNTIEPPFLYDIKATDIINDQEGNLWVSTIGSGLLFLPNEKLIRIPISETQNAKQLNLTCISKDKKGNIFVGTGNGKILQINRFNQHSMTYSSGDDKEMEFVKIINDKIYSSRGIFEKNNPTIVAPFYLGKDISMDAYGNFLVGSYNLSGIISKDLGKSPQLPLFLVGKLTSSKYSFYEQHIYILKRKRTRAVYADTMTNSYYSGNSDGLFLFSERFKTDEIRAPNNKPIIASQIIGDREGNIWVASIQQGLFKIKGGKVVGQLNMTNGLPSNQCKKMRIDHEGLWLVTDAGLHLVNRNNLRVKHISTNVGLDGIMINDIEIDNNVIYMATNEGLLTTKTSFISEEVAPNFSIVEGRAFGQIIQSNANLKYNQNNISLKFRTIHFRSLGNYVYQYRLLGLSPEWVTQDAKIKEVNFFALSPGSYVFEARVNLGDVFSPIQRFSFSISKPFWLSIWFILLVIFFILVVLYYLFDWQIKKVNARQNVREQLALSQITALRAQMNPHFMFNILNAFQGLIYTNQKTKANEYLGVFSDLMRKTLDISDQREITIHEELEAVALYVQLEEARFDSGDFHFTLLTSDQEALKNYYIPSLILQPYIENAIKHGLWHKTGDKLLRLTITKEKDAYWRFEIEDNGIGRAQSMERNKKLRKHKSFATKAIDTRIELMNKLNKIPILLEVIDLKDNLNEPCGTRVILRIPIKKK